MRFDSFVAGPLPKVEQHLLVALQHYPWAGVLPHDYPAVAARIGPDPLAREDLPRVCRRQANDSRQFGQAPLPIASGHTREALLPPLADQRAPIHRPLELDIGRHDALNQRAHRPVTWTLRRHDRYPPAGLLLAHHPVAPVCSVLDPQHPSARHADHPRREAIEPFAGRRVRFLRTAGAEHQG